MDGVNSFTCLCPNNKVGALCQGIDLSRTRSRNLVNHKNMWWCEMVARNGGRDKIIKVANFENADAYVCYL